MAARGASDRAWIYAIDLHLSEERVRGEIGFTRCVLISTVDREEL